jgi:hypothetical protein
VPHKITPKLADSKINFIHVVFYMMLSGVEMILEAYLTTCTDLQMCSDGEFSKQIIREGGVLILSNSIMSNQKKCEFLTKRNMYTENE